MTDDNDVPDDRPHPIADVALELQGGPFDGLVIHVSQETAAEEGFVLPLADMLSDENIGRMMESEPKKRVYRISSIKDFERAFLWEARTDDDLKEPV